MASRWTINRANLKSTTLLSWQGLKWSFISKVESLFKRELYAAQAASYTIKSLKPPSPIQKKLALLAKNLWLNMIRSG